MNYNGLPMANYVDVFLAVMAVHLAASFLSPIYLLMSYAIFMSIRLAIAYHFEL